MEIIKTDILQLLLSCLEIFHQLKKYHQDISSVMELMVIILILENNEFYNWGRGDYGVFGNGESKSLWEPKINEYFIYLKE